jgi:tRNA(fMet)-specific endonuclease VapC
MKMLDTNVCSYILRAQPRLAGVDSLSLDEISISALVAAELRFGAAKRQSASLSAGLERFLDGIMIADWPAEAAIHYAKIRTQLERVGQPIGGMDLLIAAHALAINATLVTHNIREFARIPKLQIEAW